VESQPTPPTGHGSVVHCDGSAQLSLERGHIEEVLRSGTFLWLDLQQPEAGDSDVLRGIDFNAGTLGPGRAIPVDSTATRVPVAYAPPDEDRPPRTASLGALPRHDPCDEALPLRSCASLRAGRGDRRAGALYAVVDGPGQLLPGLSELDDRIDELEDDLPHADDAQLREISR
jgi:hypothetical protein